MHCIRALKFGEVMRAPTMTSGRDKGCSRVNFLSLNFASLHYIQLDQPSLETSAYLLYIARRYGTVRVT